MRGTGTYSALIDFDVPLRPLVPVYFIAGDLERLWVLPEAWNPRAPCDAVARRLLRRVDTPSNFASGVSSLMSCQRSQTYRASLTRRS